MIYWFGGWLSIIRRYSLWMGGGGGSWNLTPAKSKTWIYLIISVLFQENAYLGIRKRVIFSIENIDWCADCLQIIFGRCPLVVLSHVQIAIVIVSKLAGSCKATQV